MIKIRRMKATTTATVALRILLPLFMASVLLQHSTTTTATESSAVDSCKRQPFRGRCPPGATGLQTRSQFVLRYYLRANECISYPYGHCVNDENEPRLFRYKEECEDACLLVAAAAGNNNNAANAAAEERTTPDVTYATIGPVGQQQQQSECQRQRSQAIAANSQFVPECTLDGRFRPLQCINAGTECFCVDERSGTELKHSRHQAGAGNAKPDCQKIAIALSNVAQPQPQCTVPVDVGPCTGSLQRWHFNPDTHRCVPFTYTGCGTNGNNYGSEVECLRQCGDVDNNDNNNNNAAAESASEEAAKCAGEQLPLRDGQGQLVQCTQASDCPIAFNCQRNGAICCPQPPVPASMPTTSSTSSAADSAAADIVLAPVDKNNPLHASIVENPPLVVAAAAPAAAAVNVCAQPKERGPCDQYQMRFYYNRDLGECKYFFYGGCEGNANNFARIEECERACVKGKQTTDPSALITTTTPVLISSSSSTGAEQQQQQEANDASNVADRQTTTAKHSSSSSNDVNSSPPVVAPSAPAASADGNVPMAENRAAPAVPAAPSTNVVAPSPAMFPPMNRCQHPLDPGDCAAQFVRWFWNAEARTCQRFTYSGCNGNGNNFASREECLSICNHEVNSDFDDGGMLVVDPARVNVCESDIDAGQCGGMFIRYGFDRRAGECRQFQYGGCGGNGNNFATIADCRRKCIIAATAAVGSDAAEQSSSSNGAVTPLSPNICEHRIEPGECTGTFQRFGYDPLANRCQPFVYGGCGGNGNNFGTEEDCRAACVRAQCPPEQNCDLARCQLVRDGQGCPLCSCPPPPRHPPLMSGPAASISGSAQQFQCPVLDVQLCQEPCIIFSNRHGCRECVCPLMTSVTAAVPAPVSTTASPPPPLPSTQSPSIPLQSVDWHDNQQPPSPSAPASSSAAVLFPADVAAVAPPSPPSPPAPKPILGGVSNSNNAVRPLPPPTVPPPSPSLSPVNPFVAALPAPSSSPPPPSLPSAVQHLPTPDQPQQQQQPNARLQSIAAAVDESAALPQPIAFGHNEICSQPLDPGAATCTRSVKRWYFNTESADCEPFTYTGCAGNRNHFFSKKECQIYCARFSQGNSNNARRPISATGGGEMHDSQVATQAIGGGIDAATAPPIATDDTTAQSPSSAPPQPPSQLAHAQPPNMNAGDGNGMEQQQQQQPQLVPIHMQQQQHLAEEKMNLPEGNQAPTNSIGEQQQPQQSTGTAMPPTTTTAAAAPAFVGDGIDTAVRLETRIVGGPPPAVDQQQQRTAPAVLEVVAPPQSPLIIDESHARMPSSPPAIASFPVHSPHNRQQQQQQPSHLLLSIQSSVPAAAAAGGFQAENTIDRNNIDGIPTSSSSGSPSANPQQQQQPSAPSNSLLLPLSSGGSAKHHRKQAHKMWNGIGAGAGGGGEQVPTAREMNNHNREEEVEVKAAETEQPAAEQPGDDVQQQQQQQINRNNGWNRKQLAPVPRLHSIQIPARTVEKHQQQRELQQRQRNNIDKQQRELQQRQRNNIDAEEGAKRQEEEVDERKEEEEEEEVKKHQQQQNTAGNNAEAGEVGSGKTSGQKRPIGNENANAQGQDRNKAELAQQQKPARESASAVVPSTVATAPARSAGEHLPPSISSPPPSILSTTQQHPLHKPVQPKTEANLPLPSKVVPQNEETQTTTAKSEAEEVVEMQQQEEEKEPIAETTATETAVADDLMWLPNGGGGMKGDDKLNVAVHKEEQEGEQNEEEEGGEGGEGGNNDAEKQQQPDGGTVVDASNADGNNDDQRKNGNNGNADGSDAGGRIASGEGDEDEQPNGTRKSTVLEKAEEKIVAAADGNNQAPRLLPAAPSSHSPLPAAATSSSPPPSPPKPTPSPSSALPSSQWQTARTAITTISSLPASTRLPSSTTNTVSVAPTATASTTTTSAAGPIKRPTVEVRKLLPLATITNGLTQTVMAKGGIAAAPPSQTGTGQQQQQQQHLLSNLFTSHHIQAGRERNGQQQQSSARGGAEIARQMLPIWGGFIDERLPMPSISRDLESGQRRSGEEENGAAGTTNEQQQQEEEAAVDVANGTASSAAGTMEVVTVGKQQQQMPHQQQQQQQNGQTLLNKGNGGNDIAARPTVQLVPALTGSVVVVVSSSTTSPPPPSTTATTTISSTMPTTTTAVPRTTSAGAVNPPPAPIVPNQLAARPNSAPSPLEPTAGIKFNQPAPAEVVCAMPPDAGPCRQFVARWFFNAQTGFCQQFSFGSCGGNANNFPDRRNCEAVCLPLPNNNNKQPLPVRCTQERDEGTGGGYHAQWYFNVRNLRCEQFVWQGEGGNANRFGTESECEKACKFGGDEQQQPQAASNSGTTATALPPVRHPQPPFAPPLRPVNVIRRPALARPDASATAMERRKEMPNIGGNADSEGAAGMAEDRQENADDDNDDNLPNDMQGIDGAEGDNAADNNNNDNRLMDTNRVVMVQGAPIAQTGNGDGAVGMPAPVQAIPDQLPPAEQQPPQPAAASPASLPLPAPASPAASESGYGGGAAGYAAVLLPPVPNKLPANLPPMLGNSPPAKIDYVTGKRFDNDEEHEQQPAAAVHGITQHVPTEAKGDKSAVDMKIVANAKELLPLGGSKSSSSPMANGVPVCPNGLNTMQYSDGRPVLCLPGMGQCPDKSVCYFNGIDFFCCPNEDDPYDLHVFGGYDGDEGKHGYKVFGQQQQSSLMLRAARSRRQAAASNNGGNGGGFGNSLRFDDKSPPLPARQARFQSSHADVTLHLVDDNSNSNSACIQPLQKGRCQQAHLRFFYDRDTNKCRPFHYTGCGGNQNNFGSMASCEQNCKQQQQQQRQQQQQKSTSSVSAVGGPCEGGHLPLGGPNPVLCGAQADSIGCPLGFVCVSGPPSVCCPAAAAQAEAAEIRRKPQQEVQPAAFAAPITSVDASSSSNIAQLHAQLLICPDGSDPVRNESSGQLLTCGSGLDIDGQAMCDPGFYCSIDPEKNVRFCCPLQTLASKVGSSAELFAPHFGSRFPNPGEIVGKGSMPSDRRPLSKPQSSVGISAAAKPTVAYRQHKKIGSGDLGSNEIFGHMRLKTSGEHVNGGGGKGTPTTTGGKASKLAVEATKEQPESTNGGGDDPFEQQQQVICMQRPDEGRSCAMNEPSPRSNLQYFYSVADRRCKVFFHRGCGGNDNKFNSREECERQCAGRRR